MRGVLDSFALAKTTQLNSVKRNPPRVYVKMAENPLYGLFASGFGSSSC